MTIMIKFAIVALFVLNGVLAIQAAPRDYTLGVGDQVRIQVYEWPALTGEFRVGPDGSLFLSVIGQVPAEGLTPVELAGVISGQLKEMSRVDTAPSTTVEVTEFRPFFILGEVQQPGEYAYRPGLTMLQAIGIAGGIYRMEGASVQHHRDAIASRGQLILLGLEIDQLIARKARLDAELDRRDKLEFPETFAVRTDEPYISRLLTEERLLFEANTTQYAEHHEVLTGLQAFYEAEAQSLRDQTDDAHRQLASAEEQLENVKSLVSRGLAPAPRQFDMERTVAGISANQRQLETNILRAQQSVAETKQRLLDLQWQRRNAIIAESQRTEAALEAARQKLITTQKLILDAEVVAPMRLQQQHNEDMESEVEYEIIRTSDSEVERLVVDENASVEPGDVIKVRRALAVPPRS